LALPQASITMFDIVVFASLIVASLQTGIYYEEAAPVHHDPYRPNAPAHGDVHVSGSYQHEGEVHVSGHGAARVVDSGNSYHDAYPPHHAPAYPAPVRHHEAYDPHRPNSHASGDVNVSGNYKQEGEVHVSGSGASRVVAAGNSYHDSPVHHAPAYPPHPAPAYPPHPAPAYPPHPAPVYPPHPAPAYPVPARHPPAYPAHHAPSHDNVHVSGAAGAPRVVESGNAYQDSPVHRAPVYPASTHDNVLVSGSYQQEGEVHVSGAGGVRVEDFQPSYTHAEPDYQPHVVVPAHLEQPVGAGPYEPAPYQPELERHVPEPAAAVHTPEEPVVVPYSQGDEVPEYVMSTAQYDEAHLPTLYEDEHYVPESHEIETVYES